MSGSKLTLGEAIAIMEGVALLVMGLLLWWRNKQLRALQFKLSHVKSKLRESEFRIKLKGMSDEEITSTLNALFAGIPGVKLRRREPAAWDETEDT